jgi:glycosyltransferase involved in cell wall biosynthesis
MRVAIVHDWLVVYAGAERVLEQMLRVFPEADLFALVDFLPRQDRGCILDKSVRTSFLQSLPFARKKYRAYLALMPLAIEQFDLSRYDLVISSSHAVAKGVITGPGQVHICMCYSPIRYAWDLQHQYLAESGLDRGVKGWIARMLLHYIRLWDLRTAHGVDRFIAISRFIARRIWKVYRREATVIYPPVDVDSFTLHKAKEQFYLTASRMVPYKKIPLIVEAFASMPDKELVVIGDGPEFKKAKAKAGPNVKLLGYQPSQAVKDYMQKARAFVFAAEEDFGIAPLEAQACGTPVIAYGKGGVTETVLSGETGIFFPEQSVASLCDAVQKFEATAANFDPERIRQNVERFGPARFREEFSSFVQHTLESIENRT